MIPLFRRNKVGPIFPLYFSKILCIYISGLQLINCNPKTLRKTWVSCNTYSHGIMSWEKGFLAKSDKGLRLLYVLLKILQIKMYKLVSCQTPPITQLSWAELALFLISPDAWPPIRWPPGLEM